ncbi:uncharacterized protein LOC115034018 [Acyrthosiphon pisum]|uniref:Uncharacterized protein n=1 Tax=Acyrthosiphon pisum TaxID=7029 RepID=A0A8R2JRT7_ACYPI|nr:uncharacterized protein LOC115034018 [Acyrthosiphon pisum]
MGPRSRLSGSGYRKKAAAKALRYAPVMKKTGKINKFFSQASRVQLHKRYPSNDPAYWCVDDTTRNYISVNGISQNIETISGVLVRVRGYTPYTHQKIFDFRRIPKVKSYFTGIRFQNNQKTK